jgi:ribosomal protein L11 methyltransferase
MQKNLTVVSAVAPRAALETLLDLLAAQEWNAAAWEDAARSDGRVDVFLTDPAAADGARGALEAAGAALGLALRPTVAALPAEDWAESWKRFFHVMRVSERVVIRPSWEACASRPGDCVIVLDPGMSFGTGHHETTRACLMFLDQLAAEDAGRSVVDAGCGSGILALAARKLGFTPVAAYDNDAEAVAIARANAAANDVGDIAWRVCDLADATDAADVVIANILAPVLVRHADRLAASVRPGARGALILSGILDSQYAEVRAAYAARGFVEKRGLLLGEWRSGIFERWQP